MPHYACVRVNSLDSRCKVYAGAAFLRSCIGCLRWHHQTLCHHKHETYLLGASDSYPRGSCTASNTEETLTDCMRGRILVESTATFFSASLLISPWSSNWWTLYIGSWFGSSSLFITSDVNGDRVSKKLALTVALLTASYYGAHVKVFNSFARAKPDYDQRLER